MVDTSGSSPPPRGAFRGCTLVAVMDTQSATASPAGVIARLRALLGGSSEASVTTAAGRHHLHHPRLQRGARLFLADPAGALDGRLGLRRLCLCLDLGAAARQHDGFRHLGVRAEDHSGISHQRRARAAARLPLRQPLDDVRGLLRRLAAAGGRGEGDCRRGSTPTRSCRSISAA